MTAFRVRGTTDDTVHWMGAPMPHILDVLQDGPPGPSRNLGYVDHVRSPVTCLICLATRRP